MTTQEIIIKIGALRKEGAFYDDRNFIIVLVMPIKNYIGKCIR